MDKNRIKKYVKQKWYNEKDIGSDLPFLPIDVVDILYKGGQLYRCFIHFRKKGGKNKKSTSPFDLPRVDSCSGSIMIKNKVDMDIKIQEALKAMFQYAVDNFGFNLEQFDIRNIESGDFEHCSGRLLNT